MLKVLDHPWLTRYGNLRDLLSLLKLAGGAVLVLYLALRQLDVVDPPDVVSVGILLAAVALLAWGFVDVRRGKQTSLSPKPLEATPDPALGKAPPAAVPPRDPAPQASQPASPESSRSSLPESLKASFEPYENRSPSQEADLPYDPPSDPTGAAFMAALRKEHRRGKRIQDRIGIGGVRGAPDGPATVQEVNSWEEDVCHIFETRGRADCIERFMYDPPEKPNAIGTILGGIEVILDRPLKKRMSRRMAALSGIIRDLDPQALP
jgi:hypothetical protein